MLSNCQFIALEYEVGEREIVSTGAYEMYYARNREEAVQNLLYSRRVSNAYAKLGPSGSVVHVGNRCWVLTPHRVAGIKAAAGL